MLSSKPVHKESLQNEKNDLKNRRFSLLQEASKNKDVVVVKEALQDQLKQERSLRNREAKDAKRRKIEQSYRKTFDLTSDDKDDEEHEEEAHQTLLVKPQRVIFSLGLTELQEELNNAKLLQRQIQHKIACLELLISKNSV